jgi:hypothetical protein
MNWVGRSGGLPALFRSVDVASRKTDLQDPLERKNLSSYLVYGLHLISDRLIPGLIPLKFSEPKTPEISVTFRACDSSEPSRAVEDEALWYTSDFSDEQGNPALKIWKQNRNGCYRIHYSHGLEFWVDREASSIWLAKGVETSLSEAAEYLLGPVFGIVLRLRGLTCLHASAVAIGDEAIAFAGSAGAGKSTTAAVFVQGGHAALADDIVPLRERGTSLKVLPGYPCLNLWPESVEMLHGTYQLAKKDAPAMEKQQWELGGDGKKFRGEELPLGAIYLLDERQGGPTAPCVEAMSSQEALVAMIANTYANKMLDPAMRAQEFALLGRLVNHVRVRRVIPHEDPRRLLDLRKIILQDFAATRTRAAAPMLHAD